MTGPPGRWLGAATRGTEMVARAMLALLEALPSSSARIGRAVGVLTLAAAAAMSTSGACGALDFACKADAWGEGVVEGLRATFSSLTQSMIQGIFSGSLGTLGEGGWSAGINLAGRVGAIMAIVVVALAAVQIIATLIAKQRQGIMRAGVGAALAWPVASVAVWAAMQLVHVVDAISNQMVQESHIETLSRLTDFTMAVGGSTPLTAGLVSLFFVFCVFVPTVLLSLMMAFRNYAIVLAIAVAPVSLMVWGFGSLREMSRSWLKVTLALILTKPVLAIALVLAAEMIVESAEHMEIGGFLTGVAGLAMAVFAPFAAMGMVSGAMSVADGNIMRGAEGAAGRFAGRTAHSVGNRAKSAGSQALHTAAQSNPKTAAVWNLAHGRSPVPGAAAKSSSGSQPESSGSSMTTPGAGLAEKASGSTLTPTSGAQMPGGNQGRPGSSGGSEGTERGGSGEQAGGSALTPGRGSGSTPVGGAQMPGASRPQSGGSGAETTQGGGSGEKAGGSSLGPAGGGGAQGSQGGGPQLPRQVPGSGRPSGGPRLA